MYRWKEGDTTTIEAALTDRGAAVDLAGADIKFFTRPKAGGTVLEEDCTILDADKGIVTFDPPAWVAGVWLSEFQVTFASGKKLTVPNGGDGVRYDEWEILADLSD